MSTLDDVDERTSDDLVCGERTPDPWESAIQATCECLSSAGTLDNLERRQAEDHLGETIYARFPVHTRSALIVAHTLMEREIVTEEELRAKMKEVRARLEMV
ncbi:ScnB [Microtetraspora malaysiensis]|uniref:ScnB n=1 Tax=Microtetraspora malaysiensis TaxID=161358 RepID=UPI003D92D9EE